MRIDMKKILILTAFALAGLAAAQDTPTSDASMPMTAADHFTRASELAVQADVAYPVAFYDRTLWKAAVDEAYIASTMSTDRAYGAYLAQLYTKTQWWINAYNAWSNLDDLSDTEKQWASLSAAKLAYIALQRGDRETAMTYVEAGMAWADSQSLQDIMKRLQ
ncbi:hypothetical protein DKM44_10650 [Deinococcus irradiatisoli]|uniref:Uncharacterized protein n=1 Tax=Deinococcus irradiatisoli TaxID=2202254 RepID=A0A2Z3JF20_9DEIO|nr:hypothetical protein [Deinococcus irradiatisoli]AWN23632.1 hypothetical protein DKM44_10650 [Deinococcus irradiatisoli]